MKLSPAPVLVLPGRTACKLMLFLYSEGKWMGTLEGFCSPLFVFNMADIPNSSRLISDGSRSVCSLMYTM